MKDARRKSRKYHLAGALTLLATAQAAWGYKIVFPDIHESITKSAKACIREAKGAEPTYCGHHHRQMRKNAYLEIGQSHTRLERSTRWPDDPTLSLTTAAAPKYLALLLGGCKSITGPTARLDEAGLTCSSHFGRLQFMHAQASRKADGTPESDELTRKKMLAWARFAYRIAIGDERVPLDGDYCSVAGSLEDIGADLAPEGFRFCGTDNRMPWRVASLFNSKCGNLFEFGNCWHRWGPKPNRRAVRFAKGALLHMVQDSYSQSHVFRGTGEPFPPRHRFVSRVVCGPARHYYEYNEQEGGHHSDADAPPALDIATCRRGAPIDDVITASARIIWLIDNRKPEEMLLRYLETSVLG